MDENDKKQEITIISQSEIAVTHLTEEIRKDLASAKISLMQACARIAKVRNEKLYKLLNRRNFEEYCEKELGITQRQGYKYATIGTVLIQNWKSTSTFENVQLTSTFSPELLQNLNVEKLYLMAKTSEDIREEVAKAVDITDITVKELKSKISELERQYRDISDKLEKTEKNISEQVKTVEKNVSEIVRETIKSQPAPPESPAPENAPAKPSFILYSDYISFIEEFSDEEAGELFKAIMLYVNNRPVPKLSKGVKAIYKHITNQLEKDFDKWQDIKEKRAKSGRKGGLQTQENNRKSEANACFAKANQAVNVNDNVNVNVNGNVNTDVINHSIDRSAYAERKNKKAENVEKVENYEKDFEAYKEIVMDNINYYGWIKSIENNNENYISVEELENIVEIITRAICSTKKSETICKSTYPREVIKSTLLKVNDSILVRVIDQMAHVTDIRNYEKYFISALFNEVSGKSFRDGAEARSFDYDIKNNLFGEE